MTTFILKLPDFPGLFKKSVNMSAAVSFLRDSLRKGPPRSVIYPTSRGDTPILPGSLKGLEPIYVQ